MVFLLTLCRYFNSLLICSGSHHKLEATCLNQEQSINELKKQLDTARNKCSKLEANLKVLEDNKQSLATDSQHQLHILQKVIDLHACFYVYVLSSGVTFNGPCKSTMKSCFFVEHRRA